jgi:hypothetical protein
MIDRPDFENACQSCGCEVRAGEETCARCKGYAILANLSEAQRAALNAIAEKNIGQGIV